MSASHNKHELDIPMLDPEGYFRDFQAQRLDVIQAFLDPEEIEPRVIEYCKKPRTKTESPIDIIAGLVGIYQYSDHYTGFSSIQFMAEIQKKLALFGRIFDGYSMAWRKATNNDKNPDVYALSALIFFQWYEQNFDLNALNTAIKLCDRLCQLKGGNQGAGLLALSKEHHLLNQLHGS